MGLSWPLLGFIKNISHFVFIGILQLIGKNKEENVAFYDMFFRKNPMPSGNRLTGFEPVPLRQNAVILTLAPPSLPDIVYSLNQAFPTPIIYKTYTNLI